MAEVATVERETLAPELERVARLGLQKLDQILRLPTDRGDGNLLRAQTTAAGLAVNAQLRADETKMKQARRTDIMARIIAMMKEEKAKLAEERRLEREGKAAARADIVAPLIGKTNRLGLSRLKKPRWSAERCAPQNSDPADPSASVVGKVLGLVEIPGASANARSLLELQQWHCRWPTGDPSSEDFGFCGNMRIAGLPYCAAHARMAYRPTTRDAVAHEQRCLA